MSAETERDYLEGNDARTQREREREFRDDWPCRVCRHDFTAHGSEGCAECDCTRTHEHVYLDTHQPGAES
jgi:hypothetical protein